MCQMVDVVDSHKQAGFENYKSIFFELKLEFFRVLSVMVILLF